MNKIKQIKDRVCLAIFALGISMVGLHELDSNCTHHEYVDQNKVEFNNIIIIKEI